jgi:hypothetical protein
MFCGVALWVDADVSGRAAAFIFWDGIWGRGGFVSESGYFLVTGLRGIAIREAVVFIVFNFISQIFGLSF